MDKSNSIWFYTILYLITQLVNHFLNYFTAWIWLVCCRIM